MEEEQLIVMPHAYKHGLTEDEIRFAWRHALYRFTRLDDSRGDVVVVIGPTDELGLLTHQMTYCAGIVGRHHDEETIFVNSSSITELDKTSSLLSASFHFFDKEPMNGLK